MSKSHQPTDQQSCLLLFVLFLARTDLIVHHLLPYFSLASQHRLACTCVRLHALIWSHHALVRIPPKHATRVLSVWAWKCSSTKILAAAPLLELVAGAPFSHLVYLVWLHSRKHLNVRSCALSFCPGLSECSPHAEKLPLPTNYDTAERAQRLHVSGSHSSSSASTAPPSGAAFVRHSSLAVGAVLRAAASESCDLSSTTTTALLDPDLAEPQAQHLLDSLLFGVFPMRAFAHHQSWSDRYDRSGGGSRRARSRCFSEGNRRSPLFFA